MKFQKGAPRPPGAGRKKGVPNRTTIELREAILQAVDQTGNEIVSGGGRTAYFSWLAKIQPASFATLLGKLLPSPHEIGGTDSGPIVVRIAKEDFEL